MHPGLPGSCCSQPVPSPAGLWTNQLESLPAEIGFMTNLQVRYRLQAHLLTLIRFTTCSSLRLVWL